MSRLLIIKEKEIGAQVADLQAISELALPVREVQEGSHNRPCPLPQRSRGRAGFPAPQQRVELLPDRSVRSAGESGRGVRVHRMRQSARKRDEDAAESWRGPDLTCKFGESDGIV